MEFYALALFSIHVAMHSKTLLVLVMICFTFAPFQVTACDEAA